MAFKLMVAAALLAACVAQQQYTEADYVDYHEPQHRPAPVARAIGRPTAPAAPKPTPVAILKQINKHNDDGSYTYGFEGADGTFKIETKFANGDVKGKYGFIDDTGKVRTVEYGADRYGFQPAGEGITVAPPTYVDETLTEEPEELEYRPQTRVQARPQQRPQPQQVRARPAPRPQPQQYQPQPQQYQAQPQPQYQAQPQPQQYQEPEPHHGPIEGANYEQQITYQAPHQYQVQENPEPQRRQQAARVSSPVPQRPHSVAGAAPVPPRPVSIPGASPVPARPLSISGASPVPHRSANVPGSFAVEQPRRVQAPRAGPSAPQRAQPQHFQPQPVQQYVQPAPAARAFQAPHRGSSSVLDQLAKDYALPAGGASVHDFSFGSY